MKQYEINLNTLTNKLKQTRRLEININIVSGILKTLAMSMLVMLIVSTIEFIINGDSLIRGILAGILFISFFIFSGLFLGPHLAQLFRLTPIQNIEKVALRVGVFYPEIKDRLSNALQILRGIKDERVSSDLSLAAFNEASDISKDKDFNIIINRTELKRSFVFFVISAMLFIFSFGFFQSALGESIYRVVNFNRSYLPPPPFELTIEPLNKTLSRGDKAVISVKVFGKAPDNITLLVKEHKQENYDSYVLRLDTGNTYRYEIPSLRQSISFYAMAHWLNSTITTKIGKINVTDKPLVRSLSGTLIHPSYTNISSRNFYEDNADLTALIGSRVELRIIANKEIKSASIIYERSKKLVSEIEDSSFKELIISTITMKTEGRKASGNFRINSSGTYYVSISDSSGHKNENPIKYNIIALRDEHPTITLIEPSGDTKVSENAVLPMNIAISDDYGFSKMYLHYKLVASKYADPDKVFQKIEIPFLTSDLSAEIPYLWDLNKIGISPEDRYEFYLEIFDNDIVSGPKSSQTGVLTVRLPSLDEVLQTARDSQKQIEKELEKALKQADEIRKEMQELNKELLKDFNKKELDWKEKKKTEDIVQKQQELAEKLSDVKDKLEDVAKSLQDNKAISQETLEKYMELQKLMTEVNSPELQKMQERLEQALQQISPEQMQKLLKEMQFDEEKFRQSIERTLKILKRLQAEQKVDALTKRAEDIKSKQDEIAKQLENANPNDNKKKDELSRQQDNLQKELDKVASDLSELDKLMKEIGDDMPIQELQKAEQELNKQETAGEMENASKQTQKGNFKQAQNSQKKASSNLSKFSDQMNKVKQEMQDRTTKEAMRKLQKSINDILKLSKEQESLKQGTQSADFNSTQLPSYADNQSKLFESLVSVANSMMALSEKSFAITPEMGQSIGSALEEMQNATEQLANRRPNNAVKSQIGAMSSLNQAASQMQDMLSAMQNQGSGSCDNPGGSGEGQTPGGMGLGEKLQQLAGQQQAINQAMKQMTQGSDGKLSPEQQAEYGRIANEQGKARKSLQELADEQKSNPQTNKKILGDIERISKEMQEVVKDIQSGEIKQETLNRQERILSRLLDATRSINDRDYEKKRESRSGKEFTRTSPDDVDLRNQEGKARTMQELLRSIQEGYTKDYENLIKRYFETIQNKNQSEVF